jgi:hypothetical protein
MSRERPMKEDHGVAQHDPVLPGERRRSGEAFPRAGTWEILDHPGCAGDGQLRAFGADAAVPRCPVCDGPVTWQLTHLAPSVSADHQDVGRLP